MYKEIYENNSMVYFEPSTDYSKIIQTGYFDKNILCKDCDGSVIGKLEDYVSRFFYGGRLDISLKKFVKKGKLDVICAENVDYKKIKLFLLSLIWRASISNNKFFSEVKIGATYEEIMRKFIIENEVVSDNFCPCVIISYREHEHLKKMTRQPAQVKFNFSSKTGYVFFIAGVKYIFKITKKENDSIFLNFTLNSDNNRFLMIQANEKLREDFITDNFINI
ncbi:MAG: hypothetical protein KAT32_01275 [Candidatus Moranbacteria bacterium]|nr:hypothetical protein [Candidatus Moranbacteria bacterium]